MHELPSSREARKQKELSPLKKLIGTLGAGLSICLILALAHDREATYTPVSVPDISQHTTISYGPTVDPACNLVGEHVSVEGYLGNQTEEARWENPSIFTDMRFDKLFRRINPPVLVEKNTGVASYLYSENPQEHPALVIFPIDKKRSLPRFLRTIGSIGFPDIDRQDVTPVKLEGVVINTGTSLTPDSCELLVQHVLPRTK